MVSIFLLAPGCLIQATERREAREAGEERYVREVEK